MLRLALYTWTYLWCCVWLALCTRIWLCSVGPLKALRNTQRRGEWTSSERLEKNDWTIHKGRKFLTCFHYEKKYIRSCACGYALVTCIYICYMGVEVNSKFFWIKYEMIQFFHRCNILRAYLMDYDGLRLKCVEIS